ncbi:hypothetical protein [Marinoscillum furvescens]|uniref:Surface glycan-binding protein B xyloglucan binding domain-containing protein n=1 Tax=Marinoscillum furvescens DSM 4134 TaxID=1122208 RepID=A0A3D9L7U6_MARFU|nr:hypothetical protein [Marinoscillum furvescens]REE01555.1 hypothetical protein C7460_10371 [Marinoscillum furvescens DSM 4134]
MKMQKHNNRWKGLLLAIALPLLMACNEEMAMPEIQEVINTRDSLSGEEGFPGDLIFIDGAGFSDVSRITFTSVATETEVNAVYNPAVQSDITLMVNVPFDEEAGSELGPQTVKIYNSEGEFTTIDFTILQPDPFIEEFSVQVAEPGDVVGIIGQWFQNLQAVFFGDLPMEVVASTSTTIQAKVPEDAVEGANVRVVTTAGDTLSSGRLELDLGTFYLVSDFDDNGTHPNGDDGGQWWTWGDLTSGGENDENPVDGSYYQYTWDGTLENYYLGGSTNQSEDFGIQQTDPSKVFFQAYVTGAGTGAKPDVVLRTDGGIHWVYEIEGTDSWELVSIPLSDFTARDATDEPLDPSTVGRVGFEFNTSVNTGYSPENPMIFRLDNVRFLEKD